MCGLVVGMSSSGRGHEALDKAVTQLSLSGSISFLYHTGLLTVVLFLGNSYLQWWPTWGYL